MVKVTCCSLISNRQNLMNPEPSPAPMSDLEAYVDCMAQLLQLSIPPEIRPSVIENFARARAIAQPLLDFELPDDIEAAPIFKP